MTAISVTKARQNIYQLLNEVNENSEPVTITNTKGKNGVLISEDDWKAIQETLYLASVPGMVDSIREGGETPIEDCIPEEEVDW
ncbi:type II toxin-antitoxin system Phd/YefM family antitoxin [Dialister sp.]|uniref:type II toxin-antitoxin system Phd/YefM family antitoxin n=1 Tax=Dialister sp. TaxID=1955814 RepID=UPI002E81E0E5|nr:type II toxin-antitoxin system Phd/YefM family antitoxin [Dialister sp.]MEE3453869.1 type II toxin-antitoxin system Phd/YefM family antitoxin [Dialister sp.]